MEKFCKDNVVSQNALLMASTILNLNKYAFTDKTLITTIFNGRTNPNYENTQGFLIKTLPIIISNENRQETVKKFIKHVDKTWKETINNSNYPYTKIAEEFQLKPEFLYSYQEFLEDENLSIGDQRFESYELVDEDFAGTEYKIDLTIMEAEDKININIGYNDQLYTKEYIEQFIGSIKRIISQFIENDIDKLRICDVELESEVDAPEFSPIELLSLTKRQIKLQMH